jgi:hypothetical protein
MSLKEKEYLFINIITQLIRVTGLKEDLKEKENKLIRIKVLTKAISLMVKNKVKEHLNGKVEKNMLVDLKMVI